MAGAAGARSVIHDSGLDHRIWDAVVVGAGPAGALTAYDLGRKGLGVLLVDRSPFPRWKVCGACLSRGARAVLAEAGLGDLASDLGAVPLTTLRLTGWGRTAHLTLRGAAALSRATLDQGLVDAACREGVRFLSGTRARLGRVTSEGRRVELRLGERTVSLTARVVVAADGLAGSLLGGDPKSDVGGARVGSRVGLGASFETGPDAYLPGTIHMAVAAAGYVGLVRLEDGSLNVAAAVDPPALRDRTPGHLVADILRYSGLPVPSREPSTPWRGTPALTRSPEVPGAERVFRVGDSAGYVEPFTGEGICWALSGARALAPLVARASESWDPDLLKRWSATRRRVLVPAQRLSRAMTWVLRRPRPMMALLALLQAVPAVAGPVAERAGRAPLLRPGES